MEGWLVVVCREHRGAIADLTDREAQALGPLLKLTSAAMHDRLGCAKTYAVQFAEDPLHPHVHFHLIPRSANDPDEFKGPRIFARLGVPDAEAVGESRMNEIASSLSDYLEAAAVVESPRT